MNLVRQLDEHIWHEFVDRHPQGTVFQTPEMFQVFAQTNGYHPELWAVVDDDENPITLFVPVKIALVAGLLSGFTSRSIAYGSVLCMPGVEGRQALDILLQAYNHATKQDVLFTELRNLSDTSDLHLVLSQNGFVYEEHLDFLIDLHRPPSEVLQSIGRKTRKKIRRGLRDGCVSTTVITDRSELDCWYRMLENTYRNAHVPLADRSLFQAVFDQLYPNNMARLFLARVNGVPAACSLELLYRDTIYDWYGGVDRRYGRYYPNELLHWHILDWGARNGYRVYDFGGAGKPGEAYGVRDFKAKFGGRLVNFGRYSHIHSPRRLKLSKLAYRIYQRIR
jgi:lipid II:glycine glycyltransferase (peptidoglycan interpeptide bridge formation enzyme)